MNVVDTMRGWVQRPQADQRQDSAVIQGGRRAGEGGNPYLSARRTWNDLVAAQNANRQSWQLLAILCLLIALTAIAGVIYIGSLSKFKIYVVEVNKLGEAFAVGPADQARPADPRIIKSTLGKLFADLRLVTPDVALQKKAVRDAYALLAEGDPARQKVTEWYTATDDSRPLTRAEHETVDTEITSIIPQTADVWQVEWVETVRDRQGVMKDRFRMRALATVYVSAPTGATTEEQLLRNPLSIYVRDFSWSKQL